MKYRAPPLGRGQKRHDPSPFLLRKIHTYPGNIYTDIVYCFTFYSKLNLLLMIYIDIVYIWFSFLISLMNKVTHVYKILLLDIYIVLFIQ